MKSFAELKASWHEYIPYAVLLIALAGMLISLYYSNFGDPVANLKLLQPFPAHAGLIPCDLCWYARILLYPIVAIMISAIYRNDRHFADYVLPLSALGMPLEAYHYAIQFLPKSLNVGNCDFYRPCNVVDVSYFHFITIPLLAFIAFAAITFLCWQYKKYVRSQA